MGASRPPDADGSGFVANVQYVQVWCRESGGLSLKVYSDLSNPDYLRAVGWRVVNGVMQGGVVSESGLKMVRGTDDVSYASTNGDFQLNIDLSQQTSAYKYAGVLDVDHGSETYDLECRVDLPQ